MEVKRSSKSFVWLNGVMLAGIWCCGSNIEYAVFLYSISIVVGKIIGFWFYIEGRIYTCLADFIAIVLIVVKKQLLSFFIIKRIKSAEWGFGQEMFRFRLTIYFVNIINTIKVSFDKYIQT
ncbi:hypothetical protein D3C73_1347240 [compost metagenome]